MKRFPLIIVACIAFALNFTVNADNPDLPVVSILGGKYYMYESQKGESLFGIARKFGWDDEQLQKLNPDAISPLKKGVKIYYPVEVNGDLKEKVGVPKSSVNTEFDHIIKRGETVYSIAKLYSIPVETIYRLNPSSRKGIKAGEKLKISTIKISGSEDDESDGYYRIKQGETLYSVSKAHGITVEALMKSNPGIAENNFKAGSMIKIPPRGAGMKVSTQTVTETRVESFNEYQVQKDESWTSVARKNGVEVQDLKDANPDVKQLKNKQTITIPVVQDEEVTKDIVTTDPRENTDDGIRQIYEDVHKIADADKIYTVKVAIVAENPSSNKDLEFIRGILTGIDNLKHRDFKIDLKVIDGNDGSESVIGDLDSFKPTIVFSTSEKNVPEYLSQYAEVSLTPVVNTFDVKSEEYASNPWIIQLLTPSNLFNESIAAHVYEKYGNYKLIFAGDEDPEDQLASALKRFWDASMIKKAKVEEIRANKFDPNGKYVIYGNPVKKSDVLTILNGVASIKEESPFAEIVMLGRPNWIVFDETLSDELHKAEAMIPSRFYIDRESDAWRQFNMRYKTLFDRSPLKSIPLYAAVGYDNALYFIQQLAKSNGDINELHSMTNNTVQSAFDLKRVSNWSGFLNLPVYMIKYTQYGTVDKIIVDSKD